MGCYAVGCRPARKATPSNNGTKLVGSRRRVYFSSRPLLKRDIACSDPLTLRQLRRRPIQARPEFGQDAERMRCPNSAPCGAEQTLSGKLLAAATLMAIHAACSFSSLPCLAQTSIFSNRHGGLVAWRGCHRPSLSKRRKSESLAPAKTAAPRHVWLWWLPTANPEPVSTPSRSHPWS